MKFQSNLPSESQNASPRTQTPHNGDLNSISRQIRILRQELTELNNIVSILKRDVARIDRKQYREVDSDLKRALTLSSQSSALPPHLDELYSL
jgi:hypothetical protein